MKRGFPKFKSQHTGFKSYKYYSWLRFKEFANNHSSIENVLSQEKVFDEITYKVNIYYTKHTQYALNEGLEEYKGPQSFSEKNDKTKLHYYGKGWWEWYDRSVFEAQMEKIFKEESEK